MVGSEPLTGIWEIDGLLVAAAVVVAIGTVWRRIVRPVCRWARSAVSGLDVLADIAREFKPDGGATLRDVTDQQTEALGRLEVGLAEARDAAEAAAAEALAVREQHAQLSNDVQSHITEDRTAFAEAREDQAEVKRMLAEHITGEDDVLRELTEGQSEMKGSLRNLEQLGIEPLELGGAKPDVPARPPAPVPVRTPPAGPTRRRKR